MSERIVIVTGSRNWTDARVVFDALDEVDPTVLVHGFSHRGADIIANNWAHQRTLRGHCIVVVRVPADWSTHGKSAGPIRNRRMLDFFPQATVLAFPLPGSRGTRDCMAEARRRGMTVIDRGRGGQ